MMELKEFIEKFADAVEIDPATINGETAFRELEEWNSLAGLSVLSMFDEEFDKELSISNFREAKTIRDLYTLAK